MSIHSSSNCSEAYNPTTQNSHNILRIYPSTSYSMKPHSQGLSKGKLSDAKLIGDEKILPRSTYKASHGAWTTYPHGFIRFTGIGTPFSTSHTSATGQIGVKSNLRPDSKMGWNIRSKLFNYSPHLMSQDVGVFL